VDTRLALSLLLFKPLRPEGRSRTQTQKEFTGSENGGAVSKIGIGIGYMALTDFADLRNTAARLRLKVDLNSAFRPPIFGIRCRAGPVPIFARNRPGREGNGPDLANASSPGQIGPEDPRSDPGVWIFGS